MAIAVLLLQLILLWWLGFEGCTLSIDVWGPFNCLKVHIIDAARQYTRLFRSLSRWISRPCIHHRPKHKSQQCAGLIKHTTTTTVTTTTSSQWISGTAYQCYDIEWHGEVWDRCWDQICTRRRNKWPILSWKIEDCHCGHQQKTCRSIRAMKVSRYETERILH